MEQLNRVEIIGYVGTANMLTLGETKISKIAVSTTRAYKHNDVSVLETTWHNVVWINAEKEYKRGDAIRVVGRLREVRYITESGDRASTYEIIAEEIEEIEVNNIIEKVTCQS